MAEFEKLGAFYLGKKERTIFLYDSKDLTTHAVCIGMTGSGKTGLGIALLEEAAIDKIPALIIDPKGDMGDLLLTFPKLSSEEFEPWVDPSEAKRQGQTVQELAEKTATDWKEGLKKWGQDGARIQKLKESVDWTIYTPASNAGVPLSILSSFKAPSIEIRNDSEALRDRLLAVTSSLLGLIGIEADPIKSREHILISNIIEAAWKKGNDLDLSELIGAVQNPPMQKMGALDVDTFYPPKERKALSVKLNNLLASPSFQSWMEGAPLDIQKLLYTDEGKPRHAIISIAHLDDQERMSFVTLLLGEFVTWMRRQSGTSALRALLYMDEIFGFFPPSAEPPSKRPMLTLLKQARGFGVGIVLVTQNPVDLDYKGLANCGTWFIGKLQTQRDKTRVLEGLKTASNGEIDAKQLDHLLASGGKRKFIVQNIHDKKPFLFETRWTLSFLKGPLTLTQITTLTPRKKGEIKETPKAIKPKAPFEEFYLHAQLSSGAHYQPLLFGTSKLHFVDRKNDVDVWEEVKWLIPFDHSDALWDKFEKVGTLPLEKSPLPKSQFDPLPIKIDQEKLAKGFSGALYQTETLTLYKAGKEISKIGEKQADFKIRMVQAMREKRDIISSQTRQKYQKKIQDLQEKLSRLEEKVHASKQNATLQKAETAISFGTTILGTLFGKKKISRRTISDAGSSIKKIGRMARGDQAAQRAEVEYQSCLEQLQELQRKMQEDLADAENEVQIEAVTLRPRKNDISIGKFSLVWIATN